MIVSIWRNLWYLSAGQKSSSFFLFSLRYCRYCELVILGILGKPVYAHCKWYYHSVENFCIYLRAKTQRNPPCLSGDIAKYVNFLFWILWTCLAMHTQNHNMNLYKTLMFLCMPKINFISYFFLEILYFKESCNMIGQQHFTPYSRTRILPHIGEVVKCK